MTVARDGTGYRTDCVLHLTSGMTLEASGAAHDAYASFDQTAGGSKSACAATSSA